MASRDGLDNYQYSDPGEPDQVIISRDIYRGGFRALAGAPVRVAPGKYGDSTGPRPGVHPRRDNEKQWSGGRQDSNLRSPAPKAAR